jgi:hypothetical protein
MGRAALKSLRNFIIDICLHTAEVIGSSPMAPTIGFTLKPAKPKKLQLNSLLLFLTYHYSALPKITENYSFLQKTGANRGRMNVEVACG